jgi:hypothetical protein
VSLKELVCLPRQKEAINKVLGLGDSIDPSVDHPKGYLGMNKVDEPPPFYISLLANGLLLHNCILDSGASTSIITLEVMNKLVLTISRPYRNVQSIDSNCRYVSHQRP